MEGEDFRVMVLNDSTIKVFRDGRIHTLCKYKDGRERWTDRVLRLHKGYLRVYIGSRKNNKEHFVHNVIALCYLGEKPQGYPLCNLNTLSVHLSLPSLCLKRECIRPSLNTFIVVSFKTITRKSSSSITYRFMGSF